MSRGLQVVPGAASAASASAAVIASPSARR
jgi:hypothetical protein